MSYLIFDTETSGLPNRFLPPDDENQARIVQLVAKVLDDDFRQVAALEVIIKPEGFTIKPEVAKIHGISHDRAIREGIPLKIAMELFKCFLEKADKLVAHNIKFDRDLLEIESKNTKTQLVWPEHKMYCTMLAMTPICKLPHKNNKPGFKWPKLQEAFTFLFKKPFDRAHDASSDVNATTEIFKWLVTSSKN